MKLVKEKIDCGDYASAVSMVVSALNIKKGDNIKWVFDIFKNIFDPNSYLNIHRFIFSGFYPFAGNVRDEIINKGNTPYFQSKTPFCYPDFIYPELTRLLEKMKNNVIKVKNKELLCQYLSYFYGELNMVHPFREGNGRTLRLYIELLIPFFNQRLDNPVEIDYTKMDKEMMRRATIICSVTGSCDEIEEIFNSIIVSKSKKK